MPTAAPADLLSAAKIAAQLKVSEPKVKKAIAELKIAPAAKKGVCNLYDKAAIAKIKKAVA